MVVFAGGCCAGDDWVDAVVGSPGHIWRKQIRERDQPGVKDTL